MAKPKYIKPFPLVCIYADDWTCHNEETNIEDNHTLAGAWLTGLLIDEDDEKIVLSPFLFPYSTRSRNAMVISKHSIKRRIQYK